MANNNYSIEYAKTGRSTCKNSKCKGKIEKDSLRIGKKFPSSRFTDDGEQTDWYHWNCLFDALTRARKDTKKIESENDLQGFIGLADADQALLRKAMKGSFPPPGQDGNTGGGGGSDSEKETKKKKPAKPKEKKVAPRKNLNIRHSITEIKFSAKLISEDGLREIPLKSGSNILGRGEETGIDDKRVSRTQAEIKISEADRTAIFFQKGVNPCYLKKPDDDQPIVTSQHTPYTLEDGEVINFLLDSYPFRVSIEQIRVVVPDAKPAKKETKAKDAPKPKTTPKQAKSESTEEKKGKKKKTESEEEDEKMAENDDYDDNDPFIDPHETSQDVVYHVRGSVDDEDDVVREGRKFVEAEDKRLKRKYLDEDEEESSQQEACKYGANCYQTNPEHLKRFWHPPKKAKTQSNKEAHVKSELQHSQPSQAAKEDIPAANNNNENDVLAQLKQAFAHIDAELVEEVYKAVGGNHEQAVNQLVAMAAD